MLFIAVLLSAAHGLTLSGPKWQALCKELDLLPAFTCVNADAEPLGYERDGKQFPIFFADAARAQQELETQMASFPELRLNVMGCGLGDVAKRCLEGNALLVPSAKALAAAGDDWESSETLPLYTCLAMSTTNTPDGSSRTPLFMCPDEAQRSLDASIAQSGGELALSEQQKAALSLLCTSLDQAIAMVLDGREADVCSAGKFSFVAPRQSLEFLRSGKLEDDAPPLPPSARRAMAQQQIGESDASSMIFPS